MTYLRFIAAALTGATLAISATPALAVQCNHKGGFPAFVADFKKEAAKKDISSRGLAALDGLTVDDKVLAADRRQHIFKTDFETFSARLISQERPRVPITALTPFVEVQRRLALSWGVSSRLIRKVETTDEMIEEVEATLLGDGSVRVNDIIVIISGSPMWVTGTTNLLKLHRIGERR